MKRKRSIIIAVLLVIVTAAVIKGCLISDRGGVNKESIKQNALSYIKSKYGIDAEVLNVDVEFEGSFVPGGRGGGAKAARIDMCCGSKTFRVWVRFDDDRYFDNYQYREIREAVTKRIEEEMPGGELMCFTMFSTGYVGHDYSSNDNADGMISGKAYFDGSDLTPIINETNIDMIWHYKNTEFHDCKFFDELASSTNHYSSKRIQLISFTTDDIGNFNEPASYYDKNDYTEYAPYINDRWMVSDTKSERMEPFDFRECGDFLVYSDYLDKEDTLTPVTTSAHSLIYAYQNNKYSSSDGKYFEPLTEGYYFDTDAYVQGGFVYVFYPLEKLRVEEGHDIYAIDSSDWVYQGTRGDYLMIKLNGFGDKFCIVDRSSIDDDSSESK